MTLTMDAVKVRLLQEEVRMVQWIPEAPTEDPSIVNQSIQGRRSFSIPTCNHCHRRGNF